MPKGACGRTPSCGDCDCDCDCDCDGDGDGDGDLDFDGDGDFELGSACPQTPNDWW